MSEGIILPNGAQMKAFQQLRVPLYKGAAPDSSDSKIEIVLPSPEIKDATQMQLDAIAKICAEILSELVYQRILPQLQAQAKLAAANAEIAKQQADRAARAQKNGHLRAVDGENSH